MAKKRSTTTKSAKSRARANTAATGAKRRTKATGKATSKAAATRANPRQPGRKAAKPKRVGLLDAAAQILAKAKEPMACKAIVEQVLAQKLWSSKGKTPHATLYAAAQNCTNLHVNHRAAAALTCLTTHEDRFSSR